MFYIPSIDKETLKTIIPKANKMNFGIELFDMVNPLIFNNNFESYINEIKNILSPFNGKLSAHAPFYDLNPLSIDEDIKALSIKKYTQMINACIFLGIEKIIFHTTYTPVIKLAFYEDYFIKSTIEFWKDYIKTFEDNHMTILLENTYEINPEILKQIIIGVNSDKLKMCLDIGHVNINSKISILEWIKCMRKDLIYMHLHNNNGIYDVHDSVINGSLDFKEIYKVLKDSNISPDMSFEIFDEDKLQESINFVTDLVSQNQSISLS